MTTAGWQFWIDRGGTFTDVVGYAPDHSVHSCKLLSANPDVYQDAAAEGIRRMLTDESARGSNVREIRMGTTVATNALLERKGAATGLIMTRGFGDALRIGEQDRPRLFDLHIRKPDTLFAATAEADERLTAAGEIETPLDPDSLRAVLSSWRENGIESIAICLLHAWINPVHEQAVAELAREAGFAHVYCSHEVSALMKYVARAGTTVADAYLSPVLLHYVAGFQRELSAHGIHCEHIYFMKSHGGLVSADRFRGKDAILSGPAGGVIGMRAAGERAGTNQLIGFDMGGTSTDVSVCDGEPDIVTDTEIGGVHIRAPMIRIHTIAAGGGSLLNFDNGRFIVGPESAGADPGPLSYGRGGPLALTDANVLLGRIQAQHFPQVFGADGTQALDVAGVRTAFAELAQQVSTRSGSSFTPEQTAEGFLRVAIDNMANALRHISVARGLNPADYTLCCFGGAGAQHACRIADRLGMTRILLDPHAGVLSAWGMGTARLQSYRQRSIDQPLQPAIMPRLQQLSGEFDQACRDELRAQGANDCTSAALVDLKVAHTDNTLTVQLGEPEQMRA
ncbi:MAG: hydantoinase/oxoprolinase family protein, partial [Gammaproteobacteria bacterium]|nr:hydantoinase/oxoprolinase family protein [Gammaproteobacteria bacterium]